MGLYQAVAGAKITAANWNTIYNLLKGVVGGEDPVRLAGNVAATFMLQPNTDPASVVHLFPIKNAAGTEKWALRSDGIPVLADQAGTPGSLEDGMFWRNGSKFYGRLAGATVELFTPATGASVFYTTRLTSTRTNATTTFADITGLSFSMLANTDYYFEAMLIFESSVTTTGIKLGVNGPASPSSVVLMSQVTDVATVKNDHGEGYDGTWCVSTGVSVINTPYAAYLRGHIRNGSNAGNLVLRFASEVSPNTVTIRVGSFIRWQQTE